MRIAGMIALGLYTTPHGDEKMVPGWVVAWAVLLLLGIWTTARKVRGHGRLAAVGTWPVVAAVILGAALLVSVMMSGARRRSDETVAWPVVAGKVVRSRLYHSLEASGRRDAAVGDGSLRLQLRYVYSVDGTFFEGEQVTRDGSRMGLQERAWAARYPEGASVPVHYNPADPSEAVLETQAFDPRKSSIPWVIALVSVGTLLLGLWERLLHGTSGPRLFPGPGEA
jgi:Protein of unknown function (DUF3592)